MLQWDANIFISCASVQRMASKRMWQVMWMLKGDLSAAQRILMGFIFRTHSLIVLGQITQNVSLVSYLGVCSRPLGSRITQPLGEEEGFQQLQTCLSSGYKPSRQICMHKSQVPHLLQKSSILPQGSLRIFPLFLLTLSINVF